MKVLWFAVVLKISDWPSIIDDFKIRMLGAVSLGCLRGFDTGMTAVENPWNCTIFQTAYECLKRRDFYKASDEECRSGYGGSVFMRQYGVGCAQCRNVENVFCEGLYAFLGAKSDGG